jgi:hypothetical protein
MESTYDIKAWADETTLGRRVFNYSFRMSGREVPGWHMLKAVVMHRDRTLSEMTYLWQKSDAADALVRVSISELTDWRMAQKQLLTILEHCMRPDVPRGTGERATIGDIQFVARSAQSDIPAAVQFTRGNIAASVNSVGSMAVDVSDLATIVDRVLRDPPTKTPSLRKLAKVLAPRAVTVKDRKGASLVKSLKRMGDDWLKVIVPDGELRRKGDALVYLTSRYGKKSVQIYSIRAQASTAREYSARGARSGVRD